MHADWNSVMPPLQNTIQIERKELQILQKDKYRLLDEIGALNAVIFKAQQ